MCWLLIYYWQPGKKWALTKKPTNSSSKLKIYFEPCLFMFLYVWHNYTCFGRVTSCEQGQTAHEVRYLFKVLRLTFFMHAPQHKNNNILHWHCGSSVQISTTQVWHWRMSPLTRQVPQTTGTKELQLYVTMLVASTHASTTLKNSKIQNVENNIN